MISYILEASVCLACFYSIYWLFLRKEKLLSLNRFYLLMSTVISLIIPVLSFDIGIGLFPQSSQARQFGFVEMGNIDQSVASNSPFISFELIYGIGLSIALVLFALKVLYARKRIGKRLSLKVKPIEVTETEGLAAYSFLNTIFIGKDLGKNSELKEHIIAHESAHINGMHSLDLLFFEVLKCVFWFNPFSYLYCKSIKIQHEYIADQHALELTNPASYQRSLLQLTLSQVNSSLISNFNEHPIETRLKMIQKLNSNVMNKSKTLFAVPVLALLVIAFACTDTVDPTDAMVETITEVPVEASEINPLTDQLKMIIDSMRIIEGKAKYGLKLDYNTLSDGTYEAQEIHEIPTSEVRIAAYILKSLKEAKASANGFVIEVITEEDAGLHHDLKKSGRNTFEIVTEQKKSSQKN